MTIKNKAFKIFTLLFGFLFSNSVYSASRYWVGGTGTWDSSITTNWSTSSGGAGGSSAPTSADDVIFDGSSGLSGNTITTGAGAVCNNFTWSTTVGTLSVSDDLTVSGDFTWSGAGGTFDGSGFDDFNITGSFSLNASMTMSGTWMDLNFISTSAGKTITTNGISIPFSLDFNGVGGVWTTSGAMTTTNTFYVNDGTLNLGSTLTTEGFNQWGGTFTSNNYAMTLTYLDLWAAATLNLGSSAVSITGSGTILDITTGTTLNAGTSTVTLNSSSTVYSTAINVNLGAETFYNLDVTSNCKLIRFFDDGGFNDLTFYAGQTVLFESAKTYTVSGTLTAVGTCTNYISFLTKYNGSAATISVPGAENISYVQMRDITKAGAGSITCDYCANSGTNTSVTFTNTPASRDLYWIGTSGGSWGTAANWSTNSDGTGSANTCIPAIDDNIFFNVNSITSGARTITIDRPIFCNDIDFTGLLNSPTWSNTSSDYPMFITGDYTMDAGMGSFNNEGRIYYIGSGDQLITTAGKYMTSHFILFYGSGTYYAEDDMYLTNDSDMLLTKGTLSARNKANSTTYDIYLHNNWRVNDESLSAGATFTHSTSTVYFTGGSYSTITDEDANPTFYNITVDKSDAFYYTDPDFSTTVIINNDLTIINGEYRNGSSTKTTTITGDLIISSANTKYKNTSGTTTVAGTVTIDNATAELELTGGTFTWNNNSTTGFALNSGTMTVSGATVNIGTTNTHTTSVLNIGNSSGTGDATLTVSSGTLNIADQLNVQSDGILDVTGGTVNIKATTTNVGNAVSKWVIDANGEFKQSGGTINVLGAYNTTSTYPAIAFNSSAVTTAGNITNGSIILKSTTTGVTSGYYVDWGAKTIFDLQTSVGSGTPTYTQLTNGLALKGSLTIDASTTYDADANAVSVATTWTNNGTYTSNANTVTFNGSANQSIAGSATTTFYNLTNSNSSTGITLNKGIEVTNTLAMSGTNADIDLNGVNIDLSSTGTISGETNADRIFGASGIITTTRDIETPSTLDVGGMGAILTSTVDMGTATIYRSHIAQTGLGNTGIERVYSISVTPTSGLNATLTFNYFDKEITGHNEADFALYRSTDSGDTWTDREGTINTDANTITLTGIDAFSLWTVSDAVAQALPIKLISLSVKEMNENNLITWNTASETNNDYFIIEKTIDGEQYTEVGQKLGGGNSIFPSNYSMIDNNVKKTINYYRLKQVDFDGNQETSSLISIDNRNSDTEKTIISKTNILGQKVEEDYFGIIIITYSDGSSIKTFQHRNL